MKRVSELIDVGTLDLDPENPRLPEAVQGSTQADILRYLWENDVLEELIDSYLANGYFQSEPLITLPPSDGRRVVVEGNRRLGALMILHQLPPAIEAGIDYGVEASLTPLEIDERGLSRLPVVEASDSDDVAAFLGFRHISGLKRWGSEAKARWLFDRVTESARNQSDRGVFYDVGRQVGSNARGVRSAYLAYAILRHARDILKIEPSTVSYVAQERFGVWTRLLGTANVTKYIGLGEKLASSYEGILEQIHQLKPDELYEVLSDLTPNGGQRRPILGDSRDVTDYSDVLANDSAREAMREYGSLSLAISIAREGDMGDRLREMTRTIEALTLDVRRYVITESERAAADELSAAARTLKGAVSAALAEDDD